MRGTFVVLYSPTNSAAALFMGKSLRISLTLICRMERQLMPERRVIPSNRSETPSESLEDSILLALSSNNRSELGEDVWREAYCRDVEAFSHLLHLEENERPQRCPQINAGLCAVLYDRFDRTPFVKVLSDPASPL